VRSFQEYTSTEHTWCEVTYTLCNYTIARHKSDKFPQTLSFSWHRGETLQRVSWRKGKLGPGAERTANGGEGRGVWRDAPGRTGYQRWLRSAIREHYAGQVALSQLHRLDRLLLLFCWSEANCIRLFPVRFTYGGTCPTAPVLSNSETALPRVGSVVVTCTHGCKHSRETATNIINKYKLNFHSVTLSKGSHIYRDLIKDKGGGCPHVQIG